MNIKIQIAGESRPAGKYKNGASFDGNEDWFCVKSNVVSSGKFVSGETIDLSEEGLLMVIADGMGGMNAGEVASHKAIDTVEGMFSVRERILQVASTPQSRAEFLECVVRSADESIRNDVDPTHRNMGSTIILAWLVGFELTVTWCGDSRAYLYSPENGIRMLSEDHSFVQDLVKQGLLSYKETFAHPQGNIITRCLGGGNVERSEPETRQYIVKNGDVILLCSDGLSGVLYDKKDTNRFGDLMSQENIEDVIRDNYYSMQRCNDELFEAAKRAHWYDNVTTILCKVGCEDAEISSVVNQEYGSKRRALFPFMSVKLKALCSKAYSSLLRLCKSCRNIVRKNNTPKN